MESASRTDFATTRFIIGAVLLLLALMFYYFAVLKVDYNKTGLLDLGWSDASHYFAQAKAIMKDGYPYLDFGYDRLPPMYPSGYPALMLPWLKMLPEPESVFAPFRTNQTIGVLLVLATFVFYSYLKMPLTGGFAAVLLATLPGFFTFCRSSLSEISASALIALAFMFAYLGLKEQRRWKIYLSAILLGLSLNIRVQAFFVAPLLLAMALFPVEGRRLHWLLHCLAVTIVFALGASPTLVLNTIQFHSPFKTGYTFWLDPDLLAKVPPFSLGYIPENAAMLWRELTLHPQRITVSNYFGTGTHFVPAFMLLIGAGFFFIRVNRFILCALAAGLSFFAMTISYYPGFRDLRFYLPLLILLVAVAVLPVTWAAENLLLPKRTIASLAIFALFAAACLGYPSRSDDRGRKANRLQSLEALHFKTRLRQSAELIAQRHFVESVGQEGGVVFSDINPLYLNALFPPGFVAAPLDGERYALFKHAVHYDRAQALALAEVSRLRSIPVYALFVSMKEHNEKASRLPNVPGYQWVPAGNNEDQTVILRLTSTQ